MNLAKLYLDLWALQYRLVNNYMQGWIEGMDKMNREYTNEIK